MTSGKATQEEVRAGQGQPGAQHAQPACGPVLKQVLCDSDLEQPKGNGGHYSRYVCGVWLLDSSRLQHPRFMLCGSMVYVWCTN
jgi:hypothetical protein